MTAPVALHQFLLARMTNHVTVPLDESVELDPRVPEETDDEAATARAPTDRFHLQLHGETREMSRYELVIGRDGSQLKENAPATPDGRMSWGTGFLKGSQVDIRFMTVWLSRLIEQPVGDQTGLKSTYDFELRWAPESTPKRQFVEAEPEPANSTGPSIFTAIQEQLGLKLEPRKGPVPVLVIDHVEKPMPD